MKAKAILIVIIFVFVLLPASHADDTNCVFTVKGVIAKVSAFRGKWIPVDRIRLKKGDLLSADIGIFVENSKEDNKPGGYVWDAAKYGLMFRYNGEKKIEISQQFDPKSPDPMIHVNGVSKSIIYHSNSIERLKKNGNATVESLTLVNELLPSGFSELPDILPNLKYLCIRNYGSLENLYETIRKNRNLEYIRVLDENLNKELMSNESVLKAISQSKISIIEVAVNDAKTAKLIESLTNIHGIEIVIKDGVDLSFLHRLAPRLKHVSLELKKCAGRIEEIFGWFAETGTAESLFIETSLDEHVDRTVSLDMGSLPLLGCFSIEYYAGNQRQARFVDYYADMITLELNNIEKCEKLSFLELYGVKIDEGLFSNKALMFLQITCVKYNSAPNSICNISRLFSYNMNSISIREIYNILKSSIEDIYFNNITAFCVMDAALVMKERYNMEAVENRGKQKRNIAYTEGQSRNISCIEEVDLVIVFHSSRWLYKGKGICIDFTFSSNQRKGGSLCMYEDWVGYDMLTRIMTPFDEINVEYE